MSTPPVHHRPALPTDHLERLRSAAGALADLAGAEPAPPELVGLVDLACHGLGHGADERPDALTLTHLDGPDPIGRLLGLDALDDWWALGVVCASTARRLDGGTEPWPTTFVHLVARDGASIDVLDDGRGHRHVDGPDHEPRTGRVPDLCRRMLGLPTAEPPCGMGSHLVDVWLTRLLHAGLARPALSWAEAADLHPAVDDVGLPAFAPSPAELVRAAADGDDPSHWDVYLEVCRREGRSPLGLLDPAALDWLDAGSFARWLLGEAPPWPTMLAHLDAVLPPRTADRVFATVRLSPPPAWPPGRERR